MRLTNDAIIQGPISLANSWTSDPIWLGHVADYSIQLFFSGTPGGILRLQCSNDREQNVEGAQGVTNFTLIAGSTQTIDESGDHTWSIYNAGYRWVRVQWIAGMASTGSLNSARVNGKGI